MSTLLSIAQAFIDEPSTLTLKGDSFASTVISELNILEEEVPEDSL